MDSKENNKLNEQQSNNNNKNTNVTKLSFTKRIANFLKTNWLSMFLLLCLIVVFSWLSLKNISQTKQFNQEKSNLVTTYESRIDSLKIDHIKFATEVFSWSVRSELLRNNTENLNQLLTIFIQQSGADLVQIINSADNVVLLSSDKKFEGTPSSDFNYSDLTTTIVLTEENTTKILSPIMGFNDKIGVLVVELKKK